MRRPLVLFTLGLASIGCGPSQQTLKEQRSLAHWRTADTVYERYAALLEAAHLAGVCEARQDWACVDARRTIERLQGPLTSELEAAWENARRKEMRAAAIGFALMLHRARLGGAAERGSSPASCATSA